MLGLEGLLLATNCIDYIIIISSSTSVATVALNAENSHISVMLSVLWYDDVTQPVTTCQPSGDWGQQISQSEHSLKLTYQSEGGCYYALSSGDGCRPGDQWFITCHIIESWVLCTETVVMYITWCQILLTLEYF